MNTRRMPIPSNRVSDIKRYIRQELATLYPPGEINSFISLLFQGFLGWDSVAILLNNGQTVNQSDLLRFYWAVEDLKKHRPIQHIVGQVTFLDHQFFVSPDVLIPRPETEQIVQATIRRLSSWRHAPHAILDLCTGSGCIAISLALAFPQASTSAVDVSAPALDVARRNAACNHAAVSFCHADLLDDASLASSHLSAATYDLIISNPPYVLQSEAASISPNVLDYEPHMALFVPDDDPLLFYRAITSFASSHLAVDGLLVFEINQSQSAATLSLLASMGFDAELQLDFNEHPRMVFATLK